MHREITLDEMRLVMMDIMREVDAFCTERGLRYSLGGGTLLGAVRHKGFIPWDDDVDIMLPRPDYEQFVAGFEGRCSHLHIQSMHNDPDYDLPFAKVVDTRTVLHEPSMTTGVYIDVFAVDGLPSTGTQAHFGHIRRLWVATARLTRWARRLSRRGGLPRTMAACLRPLRTMALRRLERRLNAHHFDSAPLAGAVTGRYGEREIMPADTFRHYTRLPFEGERFSCIAACDEYLRLHYGDYMQLPPESQRTRHATAVFWK